ncbi:uncharacterized protein LOC141592896 [Silene latifolia]|uniref:uncharacterized protein LOC141592896 n=1 Tax=Silene latifolia TaxID=37657 RepID=UPI003D78795F
MAQPSHLSLFSPSPFPILFPTTAFTSVTLRRNPSFTTTTTTAFSASIPPSTAAQAVAEAEAVNALPCVRTYENNMARLSLTGFTSFDQAVTAAAADGGLAAAEHINAGLDVMVVETVFPGPIDDLSTMSTRLFLPPRKVQAKARKLRSSFPKDIFSGTSSKNILAMTFRQVVIQRLLNFDLAVFVPGSQRNLEDLESEREVTVSFALSSSDESVISRVAEAVCFFALETTKKEFQHGTRRKVSDNFFHWFSKIKKFASKDSSVILYKLDDEVILENAKSLLDMFNSSKVKYTTGNTKQPISAWTSAMHSKLEKIGGFEFSKWTCEHVPVYRLEIDADRLTNLSFKGWRKTSGNKWEILLTHSQMVAMTDVLDMYFEDVYTLPRKQLSCDIVRSPKTMSQNKSHFSLLGFARTTLAAAILLVSVGVMVKLFLPHLNSSRRRNHGDFQVLSSLENDCERVELVIPEASQLEAYCCALVKKLKDCYNWNGDVKSDISTGAWIGEIPTSLRDGHVVDPIVQDALSSSSTSAVSDNVLKSSIPEIASYQVVISIDGSIVGFQPTSRVAVNHWAANPIAKELYGGKELSPGLVEPRLNIKKPENFIVLELLMSLSEDNYFALARPVQ